MLHHYEYFLWRRMDADISSVDGNVFINDGKLIDCLMWTGPNVCHVQRGGSVVFNKRESVYTGENMC